MSPDRPVLGARGLAKQVGSGRARRQVLDGVDLDVVAGEMVAVLGRSGSGKSTLLNLLGGLDRPDSGRIAIAGEEITGAGERALDRVRLRPIGFVFQSFQLIEELTGEENVLLAARLPGAPSGGRRRAAGLIARLGVAGGAAHRPPELYRGAPPPPARTNSPAASSSASRSLGRWSTTRRWCWPTRRPGTSTTPPRRRLS